MNRVKLDLRYLTPDVDRHGRPRLFVRVRVNGKLRKITIKEEPGTPEFLAAYNAAVESLLALRGKPGSAGPKIAAARPRSLGWLAAQYFGSIEFKGIAEKSQRVRRQVIEGCLREPLKPGGKLLMRDCPYSRVDTSHIRMLRDRKADKPGAANNRRKYLSAMFGWAIERDDLGVTGNPCRDVRSIKYETTGFYTWTVADVRQYVERHPIGTQAYLAFALMLFLGARRQDAVALGPRNMGGGVMSYVPKKTRRLRPDESHKPILAPLAEAIRKTPTGLKTFLVTSHGQPYSEAGFGNKMREWCDQAGLPECTAHGLKKIAATIVAELGATDRQMMALFDWTSEKMVKRYTGAARNKVLAAEAAKLLGQFSWAPDAPSEEAI